MAHPALQKNISQPKRRGAHMTTPANLGATSRWLTLKPPREKPQQPSVSVVKSMPAPSERAPAAGGAGTGGMGCHALAPPCAGAHTFRMCFRQAAGAGASQAALTRHKHEGRGGGPEAGGVDGLAPRGHAAAPLVDEPVARPAARVAGRKHGEVCAGGSGRLR